MALAARLSPRASVEPSPAISQFFRPGIQRSLYPNKRRFLAPQACQACGFQIAAIEHIERIEGNQALAVRMRDVDAALLDAAHVEGFGVNELDNQDAKEILVSQILGDEHLGQAAQ